jgi:hypothetical protein
MAYYVGDIPAAPVVIEPAREGENIDLTPFNVEDTIITLLDFDGAEIDATFTATFTEGGDVEIGWPASSPFATASLYRLNVTLIGAGARERLAPVYLVVQDDDTEWHNVDSLRTSWDAARQINDARLYQLLTLAKKQVTEYGWTDNGDPKEGQYMHARDLYNAGLRDAGSGDIGSGEFVITARPLDWMTKQVLRPKSPLPAVV